MTGDSCHFLEAKGATVRQNVEATEALKAQYAGNLREFSKKREHSPAHHGDAGRANPYMGSSTSSGRETSPARRRADDSTKPASSPDDAELEVTPEKKGSGSAAGDDTQAGRNKASDVGEMNKGTRVGVEASSSSGVGGASAPAEAGVSPMMPAAVAAANPAGARVGLNKAPALGGSKGQGGGLGGMRFKPAMLAGGAAEAAATDLASSFATHLDPKAETDPGFYAQFLSKTFLELDPQQGQFEKPPTTLGDAYYQQELAKPAPPDEELASGLAGLFGGGGRAGRGAGLAGLAGAGAGGAAAAITMMGESFQSGGGQTDSSGTRTVSSGLSNIIGKKRTSVMAMSAFGGGKQATGQLEKRRDPLPLGMTYGKFSGKKVKSYLPSGREFDWRNLSSPACGSPRAAMPRVLPGGYVELLNTAVASSNKPLLHDFAGDRRTKGPKFGYPPATDATSPLKQMQLMNQTFASSTLGGGSGYAGASSSETNTMATNTNTNGFFTTGMSGAPAGQASKLGGGQNQKPVRERHPKYGLTPLHANKPQKKKLPSAGGETTTAASTLRSTLGARAAGTGNWKDYVQGTSRSHLTLPVQPRAWNRPEKVEHRQTRRKTDDEKKLEAWVAFGEKLLCLALYLARDGNPNKTGNCSFFSERADLRVLLEIYWYPETLSETALSTLEGSGRVTMQDSQHLQQLLDKHRSALAEHRKNHPRSLPEGLKETLHIKKNAQLPVHLEKLLQQPSAVKSVNEKILLMGSLGGIDPASGDKMNKIVPANKLQRLPSVADGASESTLTMTTLTEAEDELHILVEMLPLRDPEICRTLVADMLAMRHSLFDVSAEAASKTIHNRSEVLNRLPKEERKRLVHAFLADYIHKQQEQQRLLINLSRTLIHSPRLSRRVVKQCAGPGKQDEGRQTIQFTNVRAGVTGGRPARFGIHSKRVLRRVKDCGRSFFGVVQSYSDGEEEAEDVEGSVSGRRGRSPRDASLDMSLTMAWNHSTTADLGFAAMLEYQKTQELAAAHVGGGRAGAAQKHFIPSRVDLTLNYGGGNESPASAAAAAASAPKPPMALLRPLLPRAGLRADATFEALAGESKNLAVAQQQQQLQPSEPLVQFLKQKLLQRMGKADFELGKQRQRHLSKRSVGAGQAGLSDPMYFHFDDNKDLLHHANYELEDFGDFVHSAFTVGGVNAPSASTALTGTSTSEGGARLSLSATSGHLDASQSLGRSLSQQHHLGGGQPNGGSNQQQPSAALQAEVARLLRRRKQEIASSFVVAYDARNFLKNEETRRLFAGPTPGGLAHAKWQADQLASEDAARHNSMFNKGKSKKPKKIFNYMLPKVQKKSKEEQEADAEAARAAEAAKEEDKSLLHADAFNWGALADTAGLASAVTYNDAFVANEVQFAGALDPDTKVLNYRISKILLQVDAAEEREQMQKLAGGAGSGKEKFADFAAQAKETTDLLNNVKELLDDIMPRVLSIVYRRDSDEEDEEFDPLAAQKKAQQAAVDSNAPPPLVDVALAVWTKPPTYIIARNRMNLRAKWHPESRTLYLETHLSSLKQHRREVFDRALRLESEWRHSILRKYDAKMAKAWAIENAKPMNPVEDNARMRMKALQRAWPVFIQLALSAKFFEQIAVPSEEEKQYIQQVNDVEEKGEESSNISGLLQAEAKDVSTDDFTSLPGIKAKMQVEAHPLETRVALQKYFNENTKRKTFWLFFLAKCKLKVQLGRRRLAARVMLQFLEKTCRPEQRFFFRAMNFSYHARTVQRSFRYFKFNRGCYIRVLMKKWIKTERQVCGDELLKFDMLQERAQYLDEQLARAESPGGLRQEEKQSSRGRHSDGNNKMAALPSITNKAPKAQVKYRSAEEIKKQWRDRVTANLMSEREILEFLIPELRYRRYMHMTRLEAYKEETRLYVKNYAKWALKKEQVDEARESGLNPPELPPEPLPPIRPDTNPTKEEMLDMVTRARQSTDNYLRIAFEKDEDPAEVVEAKRQESDAREKKKCQEAAKVYWNLTIAKDVHKEEEVFQESLKYTTALALDDDGFLSSREREISDVFMKAVVEAKTNLRVLSPSPNIVRRMQPTRQGSFKVSKSGRTKNVLYSEGKPVKPLSWDLTEPELDFNEEKLERQDAMMFNVFKADPLVSLETQNTWWPSEDMMFSDWR